MMDRLSPLDASFLYLETPDTHMHVASLMIFDGPIDYHDLVDTLRSRLHLVPRYRQKLGQVPFNIGRPVWVDDPYFNVEYHVRHTALPIPGGEDQLKRLCGRLMAQKLDRSKPLWEVWLVDGVGGGRSAVISKVHHCLVDGVSGAEITAVLFDLAPDAAPSRPEPWTAKPEPTSSELLLDAVRDQFTHPGDLVRAAAAAVRAPARVLGVAGDVVAGLGGLLRPAPKTPLNVPVGPHRRFEYVRASLHDFKSVKRQLGSTVNDVVLAVVSGALRAWLVQRGEDVSSLELRTMVPVSVRAESERGALGNRVSSMFVSLPVSEADPFRRLQLVGEAMSEAKQSRQVVGAERITSLVGFAPPTILAQASRLQTMQRAFNLTVTNVPGPQFPLWCAGRKMTDLFPIAPVAANVALVIAVMSYDGQLGFGLLADYDALPDLPVIAEGLDKSIGELLRAVH